MEPPLINGAYLIEKYPGKGGWTYVALPQIVKEKGLPFGWVKVCGTIDSHPIKNYNVMPMANGNMFLPVKAAIRKIIGKKEGDYVDVILFTDNSQIEIPEELKLCLQDHPDGYTAFLNYADSKKKEAIDWIYAAKKDETRVERITNLLKKLDR